MPRSRVSALLDAYNELNEVEQKVFLDLVDPQPEPEAPAKKPGKKRGPRSPRQQSLSNAITSQRAAKAESNNATFEDDSAKEDEGPKCGTCGNLEDYQDHFQPSPNYHEFEAPKAKKATSKT